MLERLAVYSTTLETYRDFNYREFYRFAKAVIPSILFIFQAYIKITNIPTSTTVDYRFGDDNNGSFYFPKITMCPDKFDKAFGDKLRQNCLDAQWGYLAFLKLELLTSDESEPSWLEP